MFTINFLSPFIVNHCISNLVNNRGNLCNTGQTQLTKIKYYEPEKSCYVNGVFYSRCGDSQILQQTVLKSKNDKLR